MYGSEICLPDQLPSCGKNRAAPTIIDEIHSTGPTGRLLFIHFLRTSLAAATAAFIHPTSRIIARLRSSVCASINTAIMYAITELGKALRSWLIKVGSCVGGYMVIDLFVSLFCFSTGCWRDFSAPIWRCCCTFRWSGKFFSNGYLRFSKSLIFSQRNR